ncbi:MAG: hypothetical protein ACRYGK_03225, partial [Janthinobacterium lividum]
MNTNEEVGAVLQKYAAMGSVQSVQQVEQDFDTVSKQAPVEEVTQGLSEAIRSDQTESFGQMVAQAFAQGDAAQKALMLNQLFQGVSTDVLALLRESSIDLAGNDALRDGEMLQLTAAQAAQIAPEHIEVFANCVEKVNPGIV